MSDKKDYLLYASVLFMKRYSEYLKKNASSIQSASALLGFVDIAVSFENLIKDIEATYPDLKEKAMNYYAQLDSTSGK